MNIHYVNAKCDYFRDTTKAMVFRNLMYNIINYVKINKTVDTIIRKF